MIKYKLSATIPTAQYGNIVPEIELEGDNEDELHAKASSFIEGVWKTYGSVPMTKNAGGDGKKIKTFTGENIVYNDATHKYYDLEGNSLLSGSAYAEMNSPKFDLETMLPKTAKAWGVDEKELGELWKINSNISTEYGSSIHSALEAWHRYNQLGSKVQKDKEMADNYVLPKNEHIKQIVLDFDNKFGHSAEVEVFVSDIKRRMVGQIDRLEIIDEANRICRVGDYKTNNDIDKKKLDKYQHQLSFYAHILMSHGWTVQGLDIYHYDGKSWEKIELPILDLVRK